MLPNFYFSATDYLVIAAVIIGTSLTIAATGWLVGSIFPSLRFVAPYAIATFACWRAALEFREGEQLAPFVVPFALAGAAVAIRRVLRPSGPRPAAGSQAPPPIAGAMPYPGGGLPIQPVAVTAGRMLFIGSAAVYGALHMSPRHVVIGILGIASALTITSTWDTARREPPVPDPRGAALRRWAMGLSLLALVVAAFPGPRVLVGSPSELPGLYTRVLAQVAAFAALAAGAGAALVRAARSARGALLSEAVVVALSFAGAGALALAPLPATLWQLARLDASIAFAPPEGWAEVGGVVAPLRRYERIDQRESVTVAPMIYSWGSQDGWCSARGIALAEALASATFGPAVLHIHRPGPPAGPPHLQAFLQLEITDAYYPCAFQADLESPSARREVVFRIASCNDERELALLHAWSADWEEAPNGAAIIGPPYRPGKWREVEQLVQCR